MLSEDRIGEVKTLLAVGKHSHRMIAQMTGVSRVVVHRIATGKRRDRTTRTMEFWERDRSDLPFGRCPFCGAFAQLPCLSCAIRCYVRENGVFRYENPVASGLELCLEEKHRIRYEQVRAWRQSQSDPDFVELPEDWPFRKT